MINELDETIKQLLIKKGSLNPAEVDIVFDMPDREWSSSISKPTVNIYLYDIHENRELRDFDWDMTRNKGKATRTIKPVRIDLSYLVTVWTNDTADQHRLLGHILTTLFRYPEIPVELLQGSLENVDMPIRTWAAQADGVLKNTADFWSALDNTLKPSISYVVTVPINLDIAFTAPETKTKAFKFRDFTGAELDTTVQISGRVHHKGKPEDGVPNAIILMKELQVTAKTDETGKYAFHSVTNGSYTVEVSVEGKKKRQLSVTIPSASYDIEL